MMRFAQARKVLLTVFILSFTFAAGYFFGVKRFRLEVAKNSRITISRELPADKQNLDFGLFWHIWDTLEQKYFDKTKLVPKNMVYGAIRGMVAAVGDPYTIFLPPNENKIVEEDLSGSFEGVGIQIGFKGTQLAVVSPLPGSPAETAGVKAGDLIVGIKDTQKGLDINTQGITLPAAVEDIRGKAGTKVTLIILRDGSENPQSIEIERAKLDVPSVVLKFVGENEDIAYIGLIKFSADTQKQWDKVIGQILSHGQVKGVIVDLRNNPGGYLQGAVDIAGEFLKNGSTVVLEEKSDGTKTPYKVNRLGRFTATPVVVLINGGSASASEILAGALRDERGIKLVGETSFGKGTIQEPLSLSDGSGLHITTARWLTPDGTWVNEHGLEPDVKIIDDKKTSEDEQLSSAISLF